MDEALHIVEDIRGSILRIQGAAESTDFMRGYFKGYLRGLEEIEAQIKKQQQQGR
jgi:hypothetical protein